MIITKRFRETFRSSETGNMMQKVADVLTRKSGGKVIISKTGVFTDIGGKIFLSYKGRYNLTPIQFNFSSSGSSDTLDSMDIYGNAPNMTPTSTIRFNGYNIVQIIDLVASVLSGDFNDVDISSDYDIVETPEEEL